MDKPGADPDRVLRELAELGLQPEDWGRGYNRGWVSAKTREGLDELLEHVALQSGNHGSKANPDKPARGHIVESAPGQGARRGLRQCFVQEGTLKMGDNFVCGPFYGRVRALTNDQGKRSRRPAHPCLSRCRALKACRKQEKSSWLSRMTSLRAALRIPAPSRSGTRPAHRIQGYPRKRFWPMPTMRKRLH